jgi:hypothetical protein
VADLLSGVKRVTHFLFTAFRIGSWFTISSPNQGQIPIDTEVLIEKSQQYCDNVLSIEPLYLVFRKILTDTTFLLLPRNIPYRA